MVVLGCTGGSFGTGAIYGSGSVGGVYTGVCGAVYCTCGGGGVYACCVDCTGGAACVDVLGWKIVAPHFGQKEASSVTSLLQLGQSVTRDFPQPEQNVSPG
jgi:hypothetical protein